jgi:hypothetical protein
MTGIVKVDTIQKNDGTAPTAADLGLNISGSVVQIVSNTNQSHNNFASVNYQQTSLAVSITPKFANSKFLIRAVHYGGVQNHDAAVSFNFYDSINPSGSTAGIAPENDSGGLNNGTNGARMSAFFGITSWAGNSSVDDWFIGLAVGEYLYTPSYQNTNTRSFGTMVRTSNAFNFRENMNGQNNTADPRDMRVRSTITVMEIAG